MRFIRTDVKLGSDFDNWLKAQEFKPKKTYIIMVGDKNHEPTAQVIDDMYKAMKDLQQFKKSRFIIAPYWIKFIKLKEA